MSGLKKSQSQRTPLTHPKDYRLKPGEFLACAEQINQQEEILFEQLKKLRTDKKRARNSAYLAITNEIKKLDKLAPNAVLLMNIFNQTLTPQLNPKEKKNLLKLIKKEIKLGHIEFLDLKYKIEAKHPGFFQPKQINQKLYSLIEKKIRIQNLNPHQPFLFIKSLRGILRKNELTLALANYLLETAAQISDSRIRKQVVERIKQKALEQNFEYFHFHAIAENIETKGTQKPDSLDVPEINLENLPLLIRRVISGEESIDNWSEETLVEIQRKTYEYLYKNDFIIQLPARSQSDAELTNLREPYAQQLGEKSLTQEAIQEYGWFLKKLYLTARKKKPDDPNSPFSDCLAPQFKNLIEGKLNKKRVLSSTPPISDQAQKIDLFVSKFLSEPARFLINMDDAEKFSAQINSLPKRDYKNLTLKNKNIDLFQCKVTLLSELFKTQGKVSFMGGSEVDGLRIPEGENKKFPKHAALMINALMTPNLEIQKFSETWQAILNNTIQKRPDHGKRDPAVTRVYERINNILKRYLGESSPSQIDLVGPDPSAPHQETSPARSTTAFSDRPPSSESPHSPKTVRTLSTNTAELDSALETPTT